MGQGARSWFKQLRIMRWYGSVDVIVGPWACRFCWLRAGRFGNGSRWCSGWHRWDDQPEF